MTTTTMTTQEEHAANEKHEGELSQDELEGVAGGFNPQPDPPGVVARYVTVLTNPPEPDKAVLGNLGSR
jgi:hypothetical protein